MRVRDAIDIVELLRLPSATGKSVFAEAAQSLANIRSAIFLMSHRLNEHLLLVMAFEATRERNHWKSEINAFVTPFVGMKSKARKKPIAADLWFGAVWEGPAEPAAKDYIERLIGEIMEAKPDLRRNGRSISQLVSDVRAVHRDIGKALETGSALRPIIEAL